MITNQAVMGTAKWLVTEYDVLNRAIRTGLLTDANNRTYHQNLAQNSTSYPYTGGSNYELLTQTFYDNYDWTNSYGTPFTKDRYTGYDFLFLTASSSYPYPQGLNENYQTRGLATGSIIKVMGTSDLLYSINFYDDKGRLFQSHTNCSGRWITHFVQQFDFSGKVLARYDLYYNTTSSPLGNGVMTKYSYDSVGRVITVTKNINNSGDKAIAVNTYNELGQMQTKNLGIGLDSLRYDYNIRGWMTGINKNYAGGGTGNYFGMELAYDRINSVTGTNYLAPQFNGNITGMVWKTKGDTTKRKYNFTYDTTNRLAGDAFLQNSGTGGWSQGVVDYTVDNLNYDANGNVMSMRQKGLKLSSSSTIDSLVYTYNTSSNKLRQVMDGANDSTSILGDFHYKGSKTLPDDYSYDGNGNLKSDVNKGIDSISYNYLNLPVQIHIKGKGNIIYTYDANGRKMKKVTMDSLSRHATTTLYIDGFVFQQGDTITSPGAGTDTLQFLSYEEGRLRYAFHKYLNGDSSYRSDYDFFERDHLGNTRVILTQERDTAIYAATMENKPAAKENLLFNNVSSTQHVLPSGFEPSTGADTSNHFVSSLNGSSGGNRIGPAIVLKVMAQDTVSANVYGWYTGSVTAPPSPEAPLINDLLNALTGDIIGQSGASWQARPVR